MYDDLRDLADTIDEVEDEIWRQGNLTKDPKLEQWCKSNARVMDKMKSELSYYMRQVKEGRLYA